MVLSLFPFYRGGKRGTERLNNLPMVAQLVMTALEPTGKHNTHHCHNMRFLTPLRKKKKQTSLPWSCSIILPQMTVAHGLITKRVNLWDFLHFFWTVALLSFETCFFPSFPLVCGDSCMALPFLSGFTFYGSYYQPLIRKLLKICVYNPEFQTDFPECKHQDRESCLFSSVIYVHPLWLAHGRCPLNMC